MSISRNTSSILLSELTTAAEIASAQRLRYAVWQAEGVAIDNPGGEVIADHMTGTQFIGVRSMEPSL